MSADLHIHVYEGLTEDDLRGFFRNTLGSKWSAGLFARTLPLEEMIKYHQKIGDTPQCWIGEVSWLKAALFEDGEETFVPNTVAAVNEVIGEDLPVLDGELFERIIGAFSEENTTDYSLAKVEDVRTFLQAHMGKQLFTVSW